MLGPQLRFELLLPILLLLDRCARLTPIFFKGPLPFEVHLVALKELLKTVSVLLRDNTILPRQAILSLANKIQAMSAQLGKAFENGGKALQLKWVAAGRGVIVNNGVGKQRRQARSTATPQPATAAPQPAAAAFPPVAPPFDGALCAPGPKNLTNNCFAGSALHLFTQSAVMIHGSIEAALAVVGSFEPALYGGDGQWDNVGSAFARLVYYRLGAMQSFANPELHGVRQQRLEDVDAAMNMLQETLVHNGFQILLPTGYYRHCSGPEFMQYALDSDGNNVGLALRRHVLGAPGEVFHGWELLGALGPLILPAEVTLMATRAGFLHFVHDLPAPGQQWPIIQLAEILTAMGPHLSVVDGTEVGRSIAIFAEFKALTPV